MHRFSNNFNINASIISTGGDETVSLVSDTWSTDVLASDSENIEQNQGNNSANASSIFSSSDALAMFQNANFSPVRTLNCRCSFDHCVNE